jgi:serine/threonine-protein kinase
VVVLRVSLGITMPDLVRQPAGPAAARLRDLDIPVRRKEAASLAVPAGSVKSTRPAKGTLLEPGQAVILVVSTGRPDVQVPEIAGQTVVEAEGALRAAHLGTQVERVFDNEVPKGVVVGTDPAIGAKAPWGSTVLVRVSKGPDLVDVPDVTGLTKGEAEERLRAAGLGASYYLLPLGDRVIRQSPGAGEQAPRGSKVRLLLQLF